MSLLPFYARLLFRAAALLTAGLALAGLAVISVLGGALPGVELNDTVARAATALHRDACWLWPGPATPRSPPFPGPATPGKPRGWPASHSRGTGRAVADFWRGFIFIPPPKGGTGTRLVPAKSLVASP